MDVIVHYWTDLVKIRKFETSEIKIFYCCPLKLFIQNKLGLTLLTKYQPF